MFERNKITRYGLRWPVSKDARFFISLLFQRTAKLGLLHEHMLIRIKNDPTSTDEEMALQSSLKSNHVISVFVVLTKGSKF